MQADDVRRPLARAHLLSPTRQRSARRVRAPRRWMAGRETRRRGHQSRVGRDRCRDTGDLSRHDVRGLAIRHRRSRMDVEAIDLVDAATALARSVGLQSTDVLTPAFIRRPDSAYSAVMPPKQSTVMDGRAVDRALRRMADEIVELNAGTDDLIIVGIQRRGVQLA